MSWAAWCLITPCASAANSVLPYKYTPIFYRLQGLSLKSCGLRHHRHSTLIPVSQAFPLSVFCNNSKRNHSSFRIVPLAVFITYLSPSNGLYTSQHFHKGCLLRVKIRFSPNLITIIAWLMPIRDLLTYTFNIVKLIFTFLQIKLLR